MFCVQRKKEKKKKKKKKKEKEKKEVITFLLTFNGSKIKKKIKKSCNFCSWVMGFCVFYYTTLGGCVLLEKFFRRIFISFCF